MRIKSDEESGITLEWTSVTGIEADWKDCEHGSVSLDFLPFLEQEFFSILKYGRTKRVL